MDKKTLKLKMGIFRAPGKKQMAEQRLADAERKLAEAEAETLTRRSAT